MLHTGQGIANLLNRSPRTMTRTVLGLSYQVEAFTKNKSKKRLHSTTDEDDMYEEDFNDIELWPLLYDEDIQHVELQLLKPAFRQRLV